MNTVSKIFGLVLLSLGLTKQAEATSLDVLEETAQQEVVDYMNGHKMDIEHGPAIISGSFKQIVLEATFRKSRGGQGVATFVIDANWNENARLPIKSVQIH